MTMRRRSICLGSLVAGILALAALPAPAQVTPDPYSPWNAMYRPFVFPNTYSSPALPNQARLPYLSDGGASPYGSSYFESMSGFGSNPFENPARIGGRGVPYYQTFRNQRAAAAMSEDAGIYDRRYTPNSGDTFYQDQAARQQRLIDARASRNPRALNQERLEQERFFQALRQRDPEARSRMLGELEARRAEATPGATTPPADTPPAPGQADLAPLGRSAAPGAATARPDARGSASPSPRGFNLLRPLAPSNTSPNLGTGSERGAGLTDPIRRSLPPSVRYPVPTEIENLLDPPGGAPNEIDRALGLPPAPEP